MKKKNYCKNIVEKIYIYISKEKENVPKIQKRNQLFHRNYCKEESHRKSENEIKKKIKYKYN